jgi:hypothetical protein
MVRCSYDAELVEDLQSVQSGFVEGLRIKVIDNHQDAVEDHYYDLKNRVIFEAQSYYCK